MRPAIAGSASCCQEMRTGSSAFFGRGDQLGLLTFKESPDGEIERRRKSRKRLLWPQTVRSRSKQAHGLRERRSRQGAVGRIEQADQSVGPLPSGEGQGAGILDTARHKSGAAVAVWLLCMANEHDLGGRHVVLRSPGSSLSPRHRLHSPPSARRGMRLCNAEQLTACRRMSTPCAQGGRPVTCPRAGSAGARVRAGAGRSRQAARRRVEVGGRRLRIEFATTMSPRPPTSS